MKFNIQIVAPFMGAWIEIEKIIDAATGEESHPSWVRGLKYLHHRQQR